MMSVSKNAATVARDFWPKLKKTLAYVPFADELLAAYYCAMDKNTPLRARGILLAALAYFIMPFDMVPDMLLGLGFTDDMAVLFAAISTVRRNMTPAHRDKARETLARLKAEEA